MGINEQRTKKAEEERNDRRSKVLEKVRKERPEHKWRVGLS